MYIQTYFVLYFVCLYLLYFMLSLVGIFYFDGCLFGGDLSIEDLYWGFIVE